MSQSGFLFLHKHHDQEASWGGNGLFSLHFHTAVHYQRKSGLEFTQCRNLETGADAETMEDAAYWLASHGLLSLLSYSPGMAPPTRVPPTLDHQLRKCLTAPSHGGISSREAPFSVITPVCVKLMQNQPVHRAKLFFIFWKSHEVYHDFGVLINGEFLSFNFQLFATIIYQIQILAY